MKRLKNKLTKKYLRFCYISHKLTIIVLLKENFFHVIIISTLLDKNSFFPAAKNGAENAKVFTTNP